jgi:hypothetical protein
MNLKRKYVKNFRAFISEQEAAPMAGAEGAAPAEPTVEDKIFFLFIKVGSDGKPVYRNKTITFKYHSVIGSKLKEWAEKFVTEKSKVEDVIEIIKGKDQLDTLPEKKYISVFKKQVENKEVGKPEGEVEVEFDDKGEAYTDKLDLNFIYYGA